MASFGNILGTSTSQPQTQPQFSVVDASWELIDPNPDIHNLFVGFNKTFFFEKLGAAEVRWSKRMTSCAGTCAFSPREKSCVISLSEPLLKLRPRKDLVETLLHEMIHAYLFLYKGKQDREAHGPLFLEHMHRVNRMAGANVTVYHSFHNEVRLYKTHWWRCEGPCKDKKPHRGFVKRAMNRAPGPNDVWWKEHQSSCGGTFIKIREPPAKPPPVKKREQKESTAAHWARVLGFTGPNGQRRLDEFNIVNRITPSTYTATASASTSAPSAAAGSASTSSSVRSRVPSTAAGAPSTSNFVRSKPPSAAAGVASIFNPVKRVQTTPDEVKSNPLKKARTQDESEWEDFRLFPEYANIHKPRDDSSNTSNLVEDDDEVQCLGFV